MVDVYPASATGQTPATPLPLLGTSRPAERTSSALGRLSLLGKCFTMDKCGVDWNMLELGSPGACVHPVMPSVSLTRKIASTLDFSEFIVTRLLASSLKNLGGCTAVLMLLKSHLEPGIMKVGAEFIGTFILIFAATASAIVNEKTAGSVTTVGTAAAAGLAAMIVILATGHISGAHLNPSLTIAFAALRHFPWIQVPAYLTAQVVASICASFVLKGVFHPDLHGGVTVPSGSVLQSLGLEFIISFNLMFVVTAVATDTKAVGELAGIAVGATVMMNILIAGATSGGSMNPVRTLGPAIAANQYRGLWLYMLGPILGALAGAAAYTIVRLDGEEGGGGRSVRSFRR